MTPKALLFIEQKLYPLIKSDLEISSLVMYVPEHSELIKEGAIQTRFGCMRVKANNWLTKGCSYIMGDGGKGFCWVRTRTEGKIEKPNDGSF